MENKELKQIKKIYGEEMMHLCRALFPTILEKNGLLLNILEKNIAPTRSLGFDIKQYSLEEAFENWIYNFINVEQKNTLTTKNPFELLKQKGYTLYECHTEEDIQKFKKYYIPGEELCTFRGKRLNRCHVFFAVKDNVDEIKRENYPNPNRQDEYGTSVISIQFSRGNINVLSIKNRYNHTVNNPDATFSNNLENIIFGLTSSFEQHYNLNISQERNNYSAFLTDKLQYVKADNGKYYRYYHEINNICYCENNIIIDNGNIIDKYAKEKERYIIIDYFIIDKKKKKIFLYDDKINDGFINSINKLGEIKSITSTKDGTIIIEYNDEKKVYIGLNKHNEIVSYKNDYIQSIDGNFLFFNFVLENIELPKIKSIGENFLHYNKELKHIELPEVQSIEDGFLRSNTALRSIELPKVQKIKNRFLYNNKVLTSLKLPNIESVGSDFLYNNTELNSIELPKIESIGFGFLYNNIALMRIELPEVQKIEGAFLYSNQVLNHIYVPKLQSTGHAFLESNYKVRIFKYQNNFERKNQI